jgi:hypothetical protein
VGAEDEASSAWDRALQARLMPRDPHELPAEAVASAALETGTDWGSHTFAEYRRCQRAFQLRRRDGIVPAEALGRDYLGIGSAVHAVLSYGWLRQREAKPFEWRDALHALTRREGGITEDTYAEAERLAHGYYSHWGQSDWDPQHCEIVAVEQLLQDGEICKHCSGTGIVTSERSPTGDTWCSKCRGTCTIGGSFALPYTARLDLILRIGGELCLVDTKTRAAKIPEDRAGYARRLRTREQFIGQAHLAMRAYGLAEPPPVIVNAIIKTKVPQFDRLRVPLELADIERWREAHALEAAEGLSGDRMNYSSCAPEIGSPCRYHDWCHGSPELRALRYGKEEKKQ